MRSWLAAERHGSMAYMAESPERRLDPTRVLPGAKSVLCVALNYGTRKSGARRASGTGAGAGAATGTEAATGTVARYARGRDYHKTFTGRLKRLETQLHEEFPGVGTRRYVDTGPVMEKLWAERAGLGWRGKHTNLLSRHWGSWLLLGEILLDIELEPDTQAADHCGACTRCIDACPTGAITGPYQLDSRLCISYLTIEHRGTIPKELRPAMGDHVFGCDDCLDVCPWNRFAREANETDFRPRPEVVAPLLTELIDLDDAGFLERFAGTALMRAKREGLARNACVALGNTGGEGAVAALARALQDPSPVVREHAAWGLGRLGGDEVRGVLRRARSDETDPSVLGSIDEVLGLPE
jgi:epoxyqueuosine reductase